MARATRGIAATLAGLVALGAGSAAHADPLGIEYETTVKGDARPRLILRPVDDVAEVTITLTDDRGDTQVLRARDVARRAGEALRIRQGVGKRSYRGEVDLRWADGERERFEVRFDAVRVGELELSIGADDVDLDARRLTCRVTNPAQRVELRLIDRAGETLDTVEVTYDDPPEPGDPLEIAWDAPAGELQRLELQVTDVAGFYTGMHITPFSITIPHDEIAFATGRSEVRSSEAPKLRATLGHIREALRAHGTLLSLKLFVAGHTDTVGSAASNEALSRRRARAIAAWFRDNGLKIPVYYTGYGEAHQAVATPDETEEPRNRRAIYILSSHEPTDSLPPTKWRRL